MFLQFCLWWKLWSQIWNLQISLILAHHSVYRCGDGSRNDQNFLFKETGHFLGQIWLFYGQNVAMLTVLSLKWVTLFGFPFCKNNIFSQTFCVRNWNFNTSKDDWIRTFEHLFWQLKDFHIRKLCINRLTVILNPQTLFSLAPSSLGRTKYLGFNITCFTG